LSLNQDPIGTHISFPIGNRLVSAATFNSLSEQHPDSHLWMRFNAAPEKVHMYFHDLETPCYKGSDAQTIAILREDRDALPRHVEELDTELERLRLRH
jgi:hypothetical protein